MSKSLFKNHKKFMQRLEMFNNFDTFDADDSGRFMDSTDTKYIIYAWFCLKSSKWYLGQTTRGFLQDQMNTVVSFAKLKEMQLPNKFLPMRL